MWRFLLCLLLFVYKNFTNNSCSFLLVKFITKILLSWTSLIVIFCIVVCLWVKRCCRIITHYALQLCTYYNVIVCLCCFFARRCSVCYCNALSRAALVCIAFCLSICLLHSHLFLLKKAKVIFKSLKLFDIIFLVHV